MLKYRYILLFFLLVGNLGLWAQKEQEEVVLTRILFVFDGSQSMYARWQSGRKIDVAQQLMIKMLDSLESLDSRSFQLALRVYGHQKPVPPQDCNDTRLEVPFGNKNIGRIKKVIRSISPKGTTPIARSLQRSAHDFTECENCRNIIILITDGVESCDEDPCAASRLLQQKGIALKPFVIGIGLDKNFRQTFDCVGTFYDAADEETFENVLGVVISQALDNTSAQINLVDGNGLPTETDVAITFYNRTSGAVAKQIVHTLNSLGNPDTVHLDPLVVYDMTVHSIPEAHKDSIRISAGRHNIIGINLPRGTLDLKMPSTRAGYKNLQCVVRESGKSEILHVQDFNTIQKYREGRYDLEILSLPRYAQKGVAIEAGKTTSIAIPPPGVVNFTSTAPGYGSILVERKNRWEWVANLDPENSRQSWTLQPGTYKVVFRNKTSRKSEYSVSRTFSISSGSSSIVKLN
ncbi:MAG: von willebrand factor type a [Owenweeksia sp.]|nr:von willebrand factor type a [Owenweeksia sp.]MBF98035.1 von willebrand factor type a [Owenweeksia sp.]HBF18455.1 von willebrand factor type a [Cryomorphaceae bacterium]